MYLTPSYPGLSNTVTRVCEIKEKRKKVQKMNITKECRLKKNIQIKKTREM